jgi:hypothetical protein
MFEKRYQYVHGWVEDVQADPYRLTVRQDYERVIEVAMTEPDWSVRLGDEVSIVMHNTGSMSVVAMADYTMGECVNLLHRSERQRPDGEDFAVVIAFVCAALLTLGWGGLLVTALFALLYGLVTHWLPESIRQRRAAQVDCMLDWEFHRWRAAARGSKAVAR